MNELDVAALLRGGMLVMLKLGGPCCWSRSVVGLLVALIQAVTQINEASLVFVPKLLALGLALMLLGPFMAVDPVRLHGAVVRPTDRGGRLMSDDPTTCLPRLPAWAFAFVLVLARSAPR